MISTLLVHNRYYMKRSMFRLSLCKLRAWAFVVDNAKHSHARIQNFLPDGVQLRQCLFVCYFDEGGEDSKSTKRGPSSNAGSVVLWFFRGSETVLLINPIFLIKNKNCQSWTPSDKIFWIGTCHVSVPCKPQKWIYKSHPF